MSAFEYAGSELDVFAHAKNWKAYWSSLVEPYIGATVLDVGAGIGSTARVLSFRKFDQWVELEPDAALAGRITAAVKAGSLPDRIQVIVGSSLNLPAGSLFDTILYIDVLEHIEDDRGELERVEGHLAAGGHIVILSPAHNWLYTPFDQAIGHYRRYSMASLISVIPGNLSVRRLKYVDSVGMLASTANKLFLKASNPSAGQIKLWDRFMVPGSRLIDGLFAGRVGKSVLCVLQKPASGRVEC